MGETLASHRLRVGPRSLGGPIRIARVVPDVTGLDKPFDYVVPDDLAAIVAIGSRVRIPLHGRRVGGWVVDLPERPFVDDPAALKPIAQSSGLGPDADVLGLCEWAARRWCAGRLRPLLVAASPHGVVHRAATPRRTKVVAEPTSPATTRLIESGGGVLRLPPSLDHLPCVLSAARRGPTLVVSPSVDGARVLAHRLRRAGLSVALLPDDWSAARGGVDVVVGGRSAAFAPCPDLAVAMVLDEHDEALQEERSPTWHARDVLVERARRSGAIFVALSPCPTVVGAHDRPVVAPEPAREIAAWPAVEVVDRSEDSNLVSSRLIELLRDPKQRVVCVVNVKGQSRLLACRACRNIVRCERCGASAGEPEPGRLHCASCGADWSTVCTRCGSTAMARLRPGTARLRFELEAAAHREVVEVTSSNLETFDDGRADVFVGTEAVLHRVRRPTAVVFLDFDHELLAPRYRAHEQALALVVRAARVLGARRNGATLLLQTSFPDHEVVRAASAADPGIVFDAEIERRRRLDLPPFSALASIEGDDADEFAELLAVDDRVSVSGREGRHLVRAVDADTLAAALNECVRPAGRRLRIAVDPPRI